MSETAAPCLVVRGTKGFLSGAVHVLEVGESMTIGRSRSADISMRKAERLYEREDWRILMNPEPFLSVSRHHVRIHLLHRLDARSKSQGVLFSLHDMSIPWKIRSLIQR